MGRLFCLMCQRISMEANHTSFFHSPQSPPCHAAIFCTERQKTRTNSDILQSVSWSSAMTHLGLQDDLDIRWACNCMRIHACHRGGSKHIQYNPRAPRHTTSRVLPRAKLIQLCVFRAVKQLETHELLTSYGENVFWQAPPSSFTLYLAAGHGTPPPVARSTWKQPLPSHPFTLPLTSAYTYVR